MNLHSILSNIVGLLRGAPVPWAFTGSTGMYLQGLPLAPRDLDIQTNGQGAYEIERRLGYQVTLPVAFRQSQMIRSHYGRGVLDGWTVEVMGDVEKSLPKGGWLGAPNLAATVRLTSWRGLDLPVMDLRHEVRAYELLGRMDRVKMMRDFLRGFSADQEASDKDESAP